jgi:ABC-type sugar transport system permease subunit
MVLSFYPSFLWHNRLPVAGRNSIIKSITMKKNVFVFGLVAGLIITCFMVYSSVNCYYNANFKSNEILGYAGMLVAFSFIFVGIKNYRDKFNGGVISFGKAFKTGFLITLVASTLYVLVWLIEYYVFIPDWIDKYCTHMINEAKTSGVTQLQLDKTNAQMNSIKELYRNPLFVILLTYVEVLPIGLVVSLISALILKRKARPNNLSTAIA